MNLITGKYDLYSIFQTSVSLIDVVTRFGIKLGNGERCIEEICKKQHVDIHLFLVIVNVYINPAYMPKQELSQLSTFKLVEYLLKSHNDYRKILFPNIENLFNDFCNGVQSVENKRLITLKFNNFKSVFLAHLQDEEDSVFKYALNLSKGGEDKGKYSLNQEEYLEEHEDIDIKLQALKMFIINGSASKHNSKLCNKLLSAIYHFEQDLREHERIERLVLTPIIVNMEKKLMTNINHILTSIHLNENEDSPLSKREIEVLKLLAHGHTVKTLANVLHISVHTATSHRKNISEKLGIKTIQGLTIYAFINGYIDAQAQGFQ